MTGSEFKAWRKSLGLTQEGAAGALGISRRGVQMYEKSEAPVPRRVELACQKLTADHETEHANRLVDQAMDALAKLRGKA